MSRTTPLPINTIFTPRVRQGEAVARPTRTLGSVLAAIAAAAATAALMDGGSPFGAAVAVGAAFVLGGFALCVFLLRFGARTPLYTEAQVAHAWPSDAIDVRALLCIRQALHAAKTRHDLDETAFASARVRWRMTEQGPIAEQIVLYPIDNLTMPLFVEPNGDLTRPVPWGKAPRAAARMAALLDALHGTTTLVKLTPLASAHGRLAFAAWARARA